MSAIEKRIGEAGLANSWAGTIMWLTPQFEVCHSEGRTVLGRRVALCWIAMILSLATKSAFGGMVSALNPVEHARKHILGELADLRVPCASSADSPSPVVPSLDG